MSLQFITDFSNYLNSKNLKTTTVNKYLKTLKAAVNTAKLFDYIDHAVEPFFGFRMKSTKPRPKFITTEEVARIEQLEFAEHETNRRIARDMYLFCCYTGLRYSDIKTLSRANIQVTDGKTYLVITMQKTRDPLRGIPNFTRRKSKQKKLT